MIKEGETVFIKAKLISIKNGGNIDVEIIAGEAAKSFKPSGRDNIIKIKNLSASAIRKKRRYRRK